MKTLKFGGKKDSVNEDIKIWGKERLVLLLLLLLLFFLSKSPGGHVIYRRTERGA